jgi:hypothetical protein
MLLHRWLRNLRSALAPGRGQRHHGRRGSWRAAAHRPKLEVLEERALLSFSPAVSYPVGGNAQDARDMVAADFNNDTVQDLAVLSSDNSTVSVPTPCRTSRS